MTDRYWRELLYGRLKGGVPADDRVFADFETAIVATCPTVSREQAHAWRLKVEREGVAALRAEIDGLIREAKGEQDEEAAQLLARELS
jgi:hypothetical protein